MEFHNPWKFHFSHLSRYYKIASAAAGFTVAESCAWNSSNLNMRYIMGFAAHEFRVTRMVTTKIRHFSRQAIVCNSKATMGTNSCIISAQVRLVCIVANRFKMLICQHANTPKSTLKADCFYSWSVSHPCESDKATETAVCDCFSDLNNHRVLKVCIIKSHAK